MYQYELHLHTKIGSRCATITPKEIVDLYTSYGYDGVVITDHFINGNSTVPSDLPYEKKIEHYMKGYEEVKRVAGDRLKVFFGLEYSYLGTDVLVYGVTKEWLFAHPEIMDMSMKDFCDLCQQQGVLAVQAHPFRTADYIDHIRIYANVEGFEVYNACRDDRCNRLGENFANEYGMVKTCGSDLHHKTQKVLSGLQFEQPINSMQELIFAIRSEKGEKIVIDRG